MTTSITKKYLTNPDYITPEERLDYIQGLKENESGFCDLSKNAQNVFNYVLSTEPERCFYRFNGEWLKCDKLPYARQQTVIVRLDVPQKPQELEYKDLDIFIEDGAYAFLASDDAIYFAHDAIGFVDFRCYVSSTNEMRKQWDSRMNETWKVRVNL